MERFPFTLDTYKTEIGGGMTTEELGEIMAALDAARGFTQVIDFIHAVLPELENDDEIEELCNVTADNGFAMLRSGWAVPDALCQCFFRGVDLGRELQKREALR